MPEVRVILIPKGPITASGMPDARPAPPSEERDGSSGNATLTAGRLVMSTRSCMITGQVEGNSSHVTDDSTVSTIGRSPSCAPLRPAKYWQNLCTAS